MFFPPLVTKKFFPRSPGRQIFENFIFLKIEKIPAYLNSPIPIIGGSLRFGLTSNLYPCLRRGGGAHTLQRLGVRVEGDAAVDLRGLAEPRRRDGQRGQPSPTDIMRGRPPRPPSCTRHCHGLGSAPKCSPLAPSGIPADRRGVDSLCPRDHSPETKGPKVKYEKPGCGDEQRLPRRGRPAGPAAPEMGVERRQHLLRCGVIWRSGGWMKVPPWQERDEYHAPT